MVKNGAEREIGAGRESIFSALPSNLSAATIGLMLSGESKAQNALEFRMKLEKQGNRVSNYRICERQHTGSKHRTAELEECLR